MNTATIQLALTAVAAGALAIQTIFMIVLAVMARKAIRTVREEMEHYRSHVIPVIDKTREVVENLTPKIEQISTEVSAISKKVREQTADIQVAANDIIARTRKQAARVDGMTTNVLNRVEQAGTFVADAVAKPMRQISGLIASVKAAVETLLEPEVPTRRTAPRVVPTPAPPRYPDGEKTMPGPRPTGTTTPFRP
jgi:hypothetical protein